MKKDYQKAYQNECLQLLRFACERVSRSCWIKANASTIRRVARAMESAALLSIENEVSTIVGKDRTR